MDGQEWEQGFCKALCSSSVFVPVMSRDAFKKGPLAHMPPHQEEDELLEPAKCDNLFLEFELALVLVLLSRHFLFSLSSLNPSPHLASLSIYLTLSLCLSRSIYLCLCLSVSHSFSSPTTGPALSDGVSVFPHWQQEVKGISIMPLFVGDKVRQQEADAHTGAYRERETARAGEREREREREAPAYTA